MQRKQAAHMRSFTPAISGSRVSSSLAKVSCTLEAAAEACATDSGMSLGLWHAPQMKTPPVLVSTGRSLGWDSIRNPNSS